VLNRVNAPDKHCPGDVGIRSLRTKDGWERVFEVRDKPVTESDVSIFVEKVAEVGVGRAAVLAVHSRQQSLPDTLIEDAASTNGVLLDIFTAWHRFVVDSFFWAPESDEFPVAVAHQRVHKRLQYIEASPAAVEEWLEISAS
jgi:hypothetical protein